MRPDGAVVVREGRSAPSCSRGCGRPSRSTGRGRAAVAPRGARAPARAGRTRGSGPCSRRRRRRVGRPRRARWRPRPSGRRSARGTPCGAGGRARGARRRGPRRRSAPRATRRRARRRRRRPAPPPARSAGGRGARRGRRSRPRVLPALVDEAVRRRRGVLDEAVAVRVARAGEPAERAVDRRQERVDRGARHAGPGERRDEQHEERRRVGRAVVDGAVPEEGDRRAAPAQLVEDAPRLLVRPGHVRRALQLREGLRRRERERGIGGQRHQGGDDRVAPEERHEPRRAGRDHGLRAERVVVDAQRVDVLDRPRAGEHERVVVAGHAQRASRPGRLRAARGGARDRALLRLPAHAEREPEPRARGELHVPDRDGEARGGVDPDAAAVVHVEEAADGHARGGEARSRPARGRPALARPWRCPP